jgi:hypothetical protein
LLRRAANSLLEIITVRFILEAALGSEPDSSIFAVDAYELLTIGIKETYLLKNLVISCQRENSGLKFMKTFNALGFGLSVEHFMETGKVTEQEQVAFDPAENRLDVGV